MTVTQQIQEIIDQVRTQPNSLERNKIISHLEDSMAWSMRQQNKVPKSLLANEPPVPERDKQCICPEGAIDSECMIHGKVGY